MKKKKYNFTAVIQTRDKGGSWVDFPYDVEKEFGTKGRVRIKAAFDGKHEYQGSLANMGTGCHILIVRKDVMKAIGKQPGNEVTVTLWQDTEPRKVNIPPDLQAELDKYPEVKNTFYNFAYTHRKEYVNWITEAKRPETRKRRLAKAIEMISEGKKYS